MNKIEENLSHFQNELSTAEHSFYVWKSINHLAANDNKIYSVLNRNALSWEIIAHSLQCTFFISMNRIFDTRGDSFSVFKFLDNCTSHIDEFSLPKLKARRQIILKTAHAPDPSMLDINKFTFYEASKRDFISISEQVCKWADIYKAKYQPIRHKMFAHKDGTLSLNLNALFERTNKEEICKMLAFLDSVKLVIFHLYHNGEKLDIEYLVKQYDEETRFLIDIKSLLDAIKNTRSILKNSTQ
jgi:AbiU2